MLLTVKLSYRNWDKKVASEGAVLFVTAASYCLSFAFNSLEIFWKQKSSLSWNSNVSNPLHCFFNSELVAAYFIFSFTPTQSSSHLKKKKKESFNAFIQSFNQTRRLNGLWKLIGPNGSSSESCCKLLFLTFQNPIQYASAPSLFPSPPCIKKVKVNIKAAWSPTNRCKLVYLW